jgi:hypothetical protein
MMRKIGNRKLSCAKASNEKVLTYVSAAYTRLVDKGIDRYRCCKLRTSYSQGAINIHPSRPWMDCSRPGGTFDLQVQSMAHALHGSRGARCVCIHGGESTPAGLRKLGAWWRSLLMSPLWGRRRCGAGWWTALAPGGTSAATTWCELVIPLQV